MEIDDTNGTGGDNTDATEKPAENPTTTAAEGNANSGDGSPPAVPTTPSTEEGTAAAVAAAASATATDTTGSSPGIATATASKDAASSTAAETPQKEPPAKEGTPKTEPTGTPTETATVVTTTSSSSSASSSKQAATSKPKPSAVLSGGPSSKTAKNTASNPKPAKAKSSSSSSAKGAVKNGSSGSNGSSNNNNNNNNNTANGPTPKPVTSGASKSLKKGARKKRKATGAEEAEEKGGAAVPKKKKPKRKKDKEESEKATVKVEKSKKARKQTKKASSGASGNSGGGSQTYAEHLHALPGLTADQIRDQEQMRKALEEEQYSANGSIVDTDSDDDEHEYMYKGQSVRLDRVYMLQAAKKCSWLGDVMGGTAGTSGSSKYGNTSFEGYEEEAILHKDGTTNNGSSSSSSKKKSSKNKKKGRNQYTNRNNIIFNNNDDTKCFRFDDTPEGSRPKNGSSSDAKGGPAAERDEGSIFGQTTGASNSIWVECDKCKKWRRLRGVVDQSKLPKKWYCSMNRNDPERARCSAPEEEYDAPITPESAADARTRKHLRVWVRRLQCNEQYESRLPTLTRNQKRSVASTSKEPHEWIRCTNPSCGKWRAILRSMDAKQHVIDRTSDGEWFCVMNTWDEKTASCAAPQENLPAVGCPPWVLQDVAN